MRVRAKTLSLIEALEKIANARLVQAAERVEAAQRFAKKLAEMTTEDRNEIESIQAFWDDLMNRLGLHEPLDREGQLTVLRNTPREIRNRYREILHKHQD
jgi:hypothetical protein